MHEENECTISSKKSPSRDLDRDEGVAGRNKRGLSFPAEGSLIFVTKRRQKIKIEVVARPVDNQKRKTEALALYQEGVEMLIQATKTIKDNPNTVLAYKKKAQEAITRAEQLKMQINQDKKEGKFHEQVLKTLSGFANFY